MEPVPDVTCVIPTFNDRKNLSRAVQSALGQEGVSVEVRLIDDASDGPTREHIEALARSDKRIHPFFLHRNGGQAQARNIGAALAKGNFLTFLDQDDEHAPGWYGFAFRELNKNQALGVVSGLARIVDLPDRLGVDDTDPRISGLSFTFITNMFFRASVFRATGGLPTGPIWRTRVAGEDGAFRRGLAHNWTGGQANMHALIHHAREGGATVHFLDRSEVRDGRVVITGLSEIEMNGELHRAQEAYWGRYAEIAREVRACRDPEA